MVAFDMEDLEERNHLGDIGIGGSTILKLKK
jgi:hypothetical protein